MIAPVKWKPQQRVLRKSNTIPNHFSSSKVTHPSIDANTRSHSAISKTLQSINSLDISPINPLFSKWYVLPSKVLSKLRCAPISSWLLPHHIYSIFPLKLLLSCATHPKTLYSDMASTTMEKNHSQSQPQQASTNYKEAFALFDKRGNGRVALESLGDLLRACGQNPTLVEISDLEQSVGGDCKFTHSQ